MQAVLLDGVGQRQDVDRRLLLADQRVDETRLARLDLSHQGDLQWRGRLDAVGRGCPLPVDCRTAPAGAVLHAVLHQLAPAIRADLQPVTVQFDQVLAQLQHEGSIEARHALLLQFIHDRIDDRFVRRGARQHGPGMPDQRGGVIERPDLVARNW